MKKFLSFFCAWLIVSVLLATGGSLSSFDDYQDVSGHWAAAVLKQAYNDGLIDGYNGYLLPDESITAAQALTILCRVFNASEQADISGKGIPPGKWYYDYAARALHMGIVSQLNVAALESRISRQDAFNMLAGAFGLVEADPDMSVLNRFSDAHLVKSENRQAMASLISQGLVAGDGGKLSANGDTTRAMFISVIYRIIKGFAQPSDVNGIYEYGVVLQGPASISGASFYRGVWFDCAATDISLNNVQTNRAAVTSHALESLTIDGSARINRLILAAQSGDVTVSPSGEAKVDTLVVGAGGGAISAKGIETIEITGNNRHVTIIDNTGSVKVSGRDNTIHVLQDARVGKIDLLVDAAGSHVVADGSVDELDIKCTGAEIGGGGSIDMLRKYRADARIDVVHGRTIENIDTGITGASVKLRAPASLPAGNTLSVAASLENIMPRKICTLTWYIDGVTAASSEITTGEAIPELKHNFTYTRTMPESSEIKVTIKYKTILGEQQEISAAATVKLVNYDKLYWMKQDAPGVMEKVTLGYKGDYTLYWAETHDLDAYDKEVWINTKGYKSSSDYLLWINLAYQRVNIFKRAGDIWELERTCIVGTGASGRGTPPGEWTTSYKQLNGWTTSSYTVRPVVRFRGSIGYAFHSRLYYPSSDRLLDASIGYPISHGCVRMYDNDVWYIYDNVPDGTTVIVY